jgi:hypothetical protein
MGNAVPRLGVDVEVTGFEAFNRNLERVNQLMAAFAKTAPDFSGAAGLLNLALKAFDDNGGNAAAALIEFGEALKNVSARKLSNLPKQLDAAAKAFQSFQKGASGAVATAQSISVPTVTQPRTGAAGGPTGPVLEPGGKQADLVAKIRRKQQDRAIADEERFQNRMRQIQERAAAIESKIAGKESRQANLGQAAQDQVSSTFDRLEGETQRRIFELQKKLQGRLGDALLNKKDEDAVKARIASTVSHMQELLLNIRREKAGGLIDREDIQSLRDLQAELKRAGVAQGQFIEAQRKAEKGGPSVAFLARARQRDAIAGLTAEQLAIGKIAKAAQSANPFVRTFARTIFAVEDAASTARLSADAFRIILGKITGTLQAISLPFRVLTGTLRIFGINVQNATGPLAAFLKLAGFKGAGEIAKMTTEVDKLGKSFKFLNLNSLTAGLDKVGTKLPSDIKGLGKKVSKVDFTKLGIEADPAKEAEKTRAAVAAVNAKAESDRSRSLQRQLAIAQQAQAAVE